MQVMNFLSLTRIVFTSLKFVMNFFFGKGRKENFFYFNYTSFVCHWLHLTLLLLLFCQPLFFSTLLNCYPRRGRQRGKNYKYSWYIRLMSIKNTSNMRKLSLVYLHLDEEKKVVTCSKDLKINSMKKYFCAAIFRILIF